MFIAKSHLFEQMRPELRDRVFALAEECSYAEGDHVFRCSDSADYLYILEAGRIRISVGDLGAVARTIRNPGDLFGWSSLVGPGNYTASAQCLKDSTVLRLSARRVDELLESDPSEGLDFYRRLAGFIRGRLIDTYRALLTYDREKKPHTYG
ncbi:MAG: cyclic nucleotide-binding domain-containing protein [Acidobacteriota bacterium]